MIVVTGATGTIGREVIDILLAGHHEVTAITRNPSAARLPSGVTVVHGNPSQPATLPDRAWHGADAVLVSPRAAGNAAAGLLAAAATGGARRVVIISSVTVQYPAGESRFAQHFRQVEDAARASGLAWTCLRCADFDANVLAWAPQIRAAGVVAGAYPEAATSPVHQRDVANVAAQALTIPGQEGKAHVLTGPQSLTQRDKVAIIGHAIGRQLSFSEVSPDQVRSAMLTQGLPAEIPDRLLGSLADYARQPGPTSGTVRELLGRPALTFTDWAASNAAAFQG
jgi:uncharacterized protein YbjT (DUF2867 family)